MVGTNVGVKKSMHSILGTRDDRDLNKIQGHTKNDDESSDKDDDLEYDSDPDYDTIDFSNWNTKKDVNKLTKRRNDNDDNNNDDKDNLSPTIDWST
jgi:hypothetical protein